MWLVIRCQQFAIFMQVLVEFYHDKESKQAMIRNRYNQVGVTKTHTKKHHTQDNQDVSPFPAGDHKAAMNRQESMTNTKH